MTSKYQNKTSSSRQEEDSGVLESEGVVDVDLKVHGPMRSLTNTSPTRCIHDSNSCIRHFLKSEARRLLRMGQKRKLDNFSFRHDSKSQSYAINFTNPFP